MQNFQEWLNEQTGRYSVGIDYRTPINDVLDGSAKLILGYISSAVKNHGYHIKQVMDAKPMRILISDRNWDDGSWTGIVSYHGESKKFLFSKGFFNKGNKTVSVQSTKTLNGTSASEITREVIDDMKIIEKEPPRPPALKPLKLKRGPK